MHIFSLYAFSTLFLQPLLALPTTLSLVTSSHSVASPISITFYPFGPEVPSAAVNAAFGAAITEISPFLQRRPNDPITNDEFYQAIPGSVHIGVAAALRDAITWQLLNTVLRRVSGFMNGVVGGRQHMQALTFEISEGEGGDRVGEGFVLYRPGPPLLSLQDANETELLVARAAPSLELSTVDAIHYRIPDTNWKLVFGFFSDAIPDRIVASAFEGAHSRIIYHLSLSPGSPIPRNRFDYSLSGVRITVIGNERALMTWKQLSVVLGGLYGFMNGPPEHYQVLTCEIYDVGHGTKGYASIWYTPPGVPANKRALLLNISSTDHTAQILSGGYVPFPVPDTRLVLKFTNFRVVVPERALAVAISAALDQIRRFWPARAASPVPHNSFFSASSGVKIHVFAHVGQVLEWGQLHSIVWGLWLFVTGAGKGEEYHRGVNFDVDDADTGRLAYGTVRYKAPKVAES